jgi:hypothetical protein
MEKVLGESFQTLKDLGVPADRVQNPEARKRYQAYLAKK